MFLFFFHSFFPFFRFLHFSSFYSMFFHSLSCSFMFFIFFHFLSFSFFSFFFFFFFLSGAQNLIFLGLNFVTISFNFSVKKNNFSAGLEGGVVNNPFEASFPVCFRFFFHPFFFSLSYFVKKCVSLFFFSSICIRVQQKMFPP